MKKIAIIDCGTNSFHLLIATLDKNSLHILHKDRVAVQVGKGGINKNILLPDAIGRATDTIAKFADVIKRAAVPHTYAFATSAFRNAINGEEVRASILEKTGINIKIISGDEEAELIFRGVNSAFDLGDQYSLIMDIGGGSVEFIIGKKDEIIWEQSFEIGAQRMLDLFHRTDPILKEELQELTAYLKVNLRDLMDQLAVYNPPTLIGSSGTFDTLSEIYCLKNRINFDKDATEVPLPIKDYKNIHLELLGKNREDRMKIPGMLEMRVDMIVVASSLINFLLENHSFKEMRVSSYALKEGVLDRIIRGPL